MKSNPTWHPRNLVAPLNYVVGMTHVHHPALMQKVVDQAATLSQWCEDNDVNYARQILIFSLMLKVALDEAEKRSNHEHIC